jgi:hypothetical protein
MLSVRIGGSIMKTFHVISEFGSLLSNLDAWLDKGIAHAKAKSFEPDVLLQARLAPDQYPLARQIQSACDAAKFAGSYLSQKEAPKHPDTEKTVDEMKKRIAASRGYLETLKEADFAGAEERRVSPPWLHGKWLPGEDYLLKAAMPNFLFHVTTAYSILRHNGVNLGKLDFLGSLPIQDA